MTPTPIYDAALRASVGREARAIVRAGLARYLPATSKAVSAQYPHPCPTCGAPANHPCRTRTTHRVTDTHKARIEGGTP